jgi:hypothetical protein
LYQFVISDGFLGSYAKNEPWYSETNRAVAKMKGENGIAFGSSYFVSDDDKQNSRTRFLRVSGVGTLGEGVSFEQMRDGMGKTILLVVAEPPGLVWTEPKDFEITENHDSAKQIHAFLKGERIVLFANGDIRILSDETTIPEFRAMCTYQGSEAIDLRNTKLVYRIAKDWIDD